jgi:hypothetical protein
MLKKEHLLILVALISLTLYAYRHHINQSETMQSLISYLPILGGLTYGLNTLFSLTKENKREEREKSASISLNKKQSILTN